MLPRLELVMYLLNVSHHTYTSHIHTTHTHHTYTQPIAHKVAQNLEIISMNFQSGTRRTRILMGFIISTILSCGTNHSSHGQNSSTLTKQTSSQDSVPPYLQLAVALLSYIGSSLFIHTSVSFLT